MGQPDVAVLNWPSQADEAALLAAEGKPRLLLVAADADPPVSVDWREDWVRIPADERDVAARMLTLAKRVAPSPDQPRVDSSGRLFYRGRWVALSPIDAGLAAVLAENFDSLVSEAELGQRGWGDGEWSQIAMRVHLTRLRHRLEPLDLEIRTVRCQGFVLQASREVAEVPMSTSASGSTSR